MTDRSVTASVILHDRWMQKGEIRISAAMTHTEWAQTRPAATVRLRQCAQTAVCRHRRVPPLPSAAPAAKRPHDQAARTHPEVRPYAWRSDGEHSPREGACCATGSGRLEGWPTASKLRVWGRQGALGVKKLGSGHVGLASTISIPVQTSGRSFRTSRSRKGLMNYLTLDG